MLEEQLKKILECAIFAADEPLSKKRMQTLFDATETPSNEVINQALESLVEEYNDRGIELKEISSGFRFQVKQDYASWVSKLWDEKPARYSRALMETLALMAYRQPITRSEIEDIRGVAVSSHIIKTLMEREWIRVVGHKDVPGRPSLFATTKQFLDYFNLQSLDELPVLSELRDIDKIEFELGNTVSDDVASADNLAEITDHHPDTVLAVSLENPGSSDPGLHKSPHESSPESPHEDLSRTADKTKNAATVAENLMEVELSEQTHGIEATES